MSTSTIVTIVVIAVIIFFIVSIYNKLVMLRNRYQNAFSQIEVQLKRRYDLIPNLIETVKGYLKHERETLESVINARNGAVSSLKAAAADPGNASVMQGLAGAEQALAGAMGKLNVVMEAYPDIKGSANMQQLSEELTTTENKVSFSRQSFNDSVTEYNTYKQTFPPVFFAGFFGHKENAELLEFADSAEIQAAPKVSF